MKHKKIVLIIAAAAVLIVAAIVWIILSVKPVSHGTGPVSGEVNPSPQVTLPESKEAGEDAKTTHKVLNINPDDIDRIDMHTDSKGTISIDGKDKIKGIMDSVNTPLTAAKEKPEESRDDVTLYFYKGNSLLGSMRVYPEGCTIGRDIYMISSTGFNMEKLMEYYEDRPDIITPVPMSEEYNNLSSMKWDMNGITDTSLLTGYLKDYVSKLEMYFSNKAHWDISDFNAVNLDIICRRPSQNIFTVSYVPQIPALGEANPKWALVFYDDGSGSIKSCRALEDEDILISDTKIIGGSYLLLTGSCKDASAAIIGYEIKNNGLEKVKITDNYSGDGFEVSLDTLLKNKGSSPVSFIRPKGSAAKAGSGFRGFTDDGFSIMMSNFINFSFDSSKKLFTVSSIQDGRDWSKQGAVSLYRNKFFKDMPDAEFPAKVEYEEIDNRLVTGFDGQPIRISICYIVPDGFVSEKSGEYEIGNYVLNVDSWSTPSSSGLYVVINDSDIMTLDDALYSGKYFIDMQELYAKLPQRYRNLRYKTLSASQMDELEQTARILIENNLEAFGNVFLMGMLPSETPAGSAPIPIDEHSIFPVKSDKYKTFADLENFVRGTYIKRTADRLLYNTFGEGPMYLEKDGKFCVDLSKEVGRGYYADWRDYSLKITDTTETSATLTVTVKEQYPSDEKEHPSDKIFKMIKQDGIWLLADMIC